MLPPLDASMRHGVDNAGLVGNEIESEVDTLEEGGGCGLECAWVMVHVKTQSNAFTTPRESSMPNSGISTL